VAFDPKTSFKVAEVIRTAAIRIFLTCIPLILLPSLASAQETSKEPIQLLNADFSELRLEEGNVMVNLIGNVIFQHGDLNLRSSRAVWYRTAGQVVFIDSVRIADPDQVLTADRVTYYRNSRTAVAEGNVTLYSRKEDARITGEHGRYDRMDKLVVFTGSPCLTVKPDKGDSSITVTADTLQYSVDAKEGLAKHDVRITKADMTATCEQATWIGEQDKIILEGNPQAEKQNDRLSGDRMDLFIRGDRINEIQVEGNARASHREVVDSANQITRESFLASREMFFFLQNEQLTQVKACGNATSTYYPQSTSEKGSRLEGDKNVASGDTIDLFLSDQQLQEVVIEGGAMGAYTFPPEGEKETSGVEDTILYSAETIDYKVKEDLITLRQQSSLKYQQISLTAGRILYQTEEQILVAQPDTTEQQGKKVSVEPPVLNDGKEQIRGLRMTYDLRSKRGKITQGVTDIQQGIYRGVLLRKITDQVLLADEGTYTTCDLKTEPHYHFYTREMKIIARDKVIAKPVVMYIGRLPVAAIPFYVFPIKPGRHSGFLTFDLGNLESNRFIRNLGYYWAASDYWDLKTAFDYYEGSGWLIRSQARYAKRYVLSGTVAGSFNRQSSWNLATLTKSRSDRWDLNIYHQQTISPSASLSASGNFLSDKNYWRDLNLDPVERRNRSLHSQASLYKRWSTASATVALDHTWNLDTDVRTVSLPVISFTRTSLPLVAAKENEEGQLERRWYNSIYYSFSSNLVNYQYRAKGEESYDRKKFVVSDNNLSLSAAEKLLGWLVINPGLQYQETWYYVLKTNLSEAFPIAGNTAARRGTYSANVSASTILYGTFSPRLGSLVGIRHVMTPTVGFSWQPKFTRKDEYLSYTGRGGSGAERKSMSFNLNNLVQVKTRSLKDGEPVEKKLDLFNLNFSSGYNFVADRHKLSILSTSLRSPAVRNLDFEFSTAHDFYDQTGKLNLLSPRWLSFSFDTRLNLRGSWKEPGGSGPEPEEESFGELGPPQFEAGAAEGYAPPRKSTWSLEISHRFSQIRGGGKTHWVSATLGLPLTRGWDVRYLNRYDFSENRIIEQTFEFYRDLHCWEARLTWIATGVRQGYYFRVNIKALPAIKIEKGGGGLREMFF
jgi:lipopolysaccharide assembly outer membrane protein LptD (OstA)